MAIRKLELSDYQKGFDLGLDDAQNNKDPKFKKPENEFQKGYCDGYEVGSKKSDSSDNNDNGDNDNDSNDDLSQR